MLVRHGKSETEDMPQDITDTQPDLVSNDSISEDTNTLQDITITQPDILTNNDTIEIENISENAPTIHSNIADSIDIDEAYSMPQNTATAQSGIASSIWSPHDFIASLFRKISRDTLIVFISTLAFGFIVHGFFLANKFVKEDDVFYFALNPATYNFNAASGRWFIFVNLISGTLSNPWVIGFITLAITSIASLIVCKCVGIKSLLNKLLVGALFVAFPTIATSLSYTFSADAIAIALLLSSLAAFLSVRYKKGFIISIIPIVLSLAIYQAYICVTMTIYILVLIVDLMSSNVSIKSIILRTLKFIFSIITGVLTYIILTRYIINIPLSIYDGVDTMGAIKAADLPTTIRLAYNSAYQLFMTNSSGLNFPYMKYLYIISLIFLLFALILFVIKNRPFGFVKLILLLPLLILFPLAANFVFVMTTPGTLVHLLTKYANIMFFVLALKICENIGDLKTRFTLARISASVASWMLIVTVFLGIHNYYIRDNDTYLRQFFAYEQGYAYSNRLIERIEDIEGYTKNTTILYVGYPNTAFTMEGLFPGSDLILVHGQNIMLMPNYYYLFLRNYMGLPNDITYLSLLKATVPDIEAKVDAMPLYPSNGSVQMMGDSIVVKFRERQK